MLMLFDHDGYLSSNMQFYFGINLKYDTFETVVMITMIIIKIIITIINVIALVNVIVIM